MVIHRGRPLLPNPKPLIDHLLENADRLHAVIKRNPIFSGPSLHFHRAALRPGASYEERIEPIYAVLASWGMHRMGAGGPKMLDFPTFRDALLKIRSDVERLAGASYKSASQTEIDELVRLASSFRVMHTGTWLVANTKVLAHLLPDLVAPIDREYTLRYVVGRKDVASRDEPVLLSHVTARFLWPAAKDPRLQSVAARWMTADESSWDSSPLKIVDNLLIAAVAEKRAQDRTARNGGTADEDGVGDA